MPARYPDTKTAVMLGVARRELSLTTVAAAEACGRSQETVSAVEVGGHRFSDDPCRKLILFYMSKLGSPALEPMLPIPQLIEALARAVLLHRVRRATELLASAESGAAAVVAAVCADGLHGGYMAWKVVRRMRYRLVVEERKRTEESA